MPSLLKNMKVNRVDLVDVGANLDVETGEGSHVLLWKRATPPEGETKMSKKNDEVLSQALDETLELVGTLSDESVAKALSDGDKTRLAALHAQLGALIGDEAEADDDEADDDEGDLTLSAEDEAEIEQIAEGLLEAMSEQPEVLDALADEVLDADEAVDLELAEEEGDDDVADDDADDEESAMLAVGKRAMLNKRYVELAKRAEQAEERAARAERIAKDERDRREEAEYVEYARGFRHLPINPEHDGPLFKRVTEKLSAEDAERIEEILKGADALLRQHGLGEMGGPGVSTDAYQKIMGMAKQVMSKSGRNMTVEAAIARVAEQHPDLYNEYRRELRERR
jgi:hypothetical protein